MNPVTLAWASVKTRPLHSLLCVFAVASGVALLCASALLSYAVEDGLARNMKGIDIIAGAKGSPLQLVLSSVYHADIPVGNIEMEDVERLIKNPQIKQAIPLAIGDNYKGWRVVGTTADYLDLYHAKFASGRVFERPFEAVAGASTGMSIGTEFVALHGFSSDSDDAHNFHAYRITGILEPTGTVLDRLIATPYESVQQLHSHPDSDDPDAAEELKLGHQITALLIRVKSPVAVMNLPREINRSTNIMAASPAYEMTRLSSSLGLGREMIGTFSLGVMILAMMMILSTLASGLTVRRYDLAVMRVLGASPLRLSAIITAEAVILSAGGSLSGLVLGHTAAFAAASLIPALHGIVLPMTLLAPHASDLGLFAFGIASGMLSALIPAISAARTDIAGLLARGRA